MNQDINHLCDYGCGREGIYRFKNGIRCCSKSRNSCPILREKNREEGTIDV